MQISARSDYALRALIATAGFAERGPVSAVRLADAQDIPLSYLHGILSDLRRAGLLTSHRGAEGGYVLARPPAQISVGDVLRAVNGTLSTVRGLPPDQVAYHGVAAELPELWLTMHAAIAKVVDNTTLADLLPRQWQAKGG